MPFRPEAARMVVTSPDTEPARGRAASSSPGVPASSTAMRFLHGGEAHV